MKWIGCFRTYLGYEGESDDIYAYTWGVDYGIYLFKLNLIVRWYFTRRFINKLRKTGKE